MNKKKPTKPEYEKDGLPQLKTNKTTDNLLVECRFYFKKIKKK